MASSSTRLEIVQTAVAQAGRSAEMYAHAKKLLNDLLRGRALKLRYRELKKTDSSLSLPAGSSTLSLPTDASGQIDQLKLGDSQKPLAEKASDDFVGPLTGASPGFPTSFYVDMNARVIRFNAVADRAYPVVLIHFIVPAAYAIDDTDDSTNIWYSDDEAITEGLIYKLYQYMQDQREFLQEQKWDRLDSKYRGGIANLQAGSAGVRLSSRFKY